MTAEERHALKEKTLADAVEQAKGLVDNPQVVNNGKPEFAILNKVFCVPLNAAASVFYAAVLSWCEALDVTISPLDIVEIVTSNGYVNS